MVINTFPLGLVKVVFSMVKNDSEKLINYSLSKTD